MKLLYILAIPALTAGISLIPTRKPKLAAGATILGTLSVFILSLNVAWDLGHGVNIPGIRDWLSCDGLSALILLLVSFVGLTASIFSWGYIGRNHDDNGLWRVRQYYAYYNLFLLSMLAVPLLSQVAIVWIAVELTTLLSVFLVSFQNTPEALEAAWKYVVLTCMGAALALIGVLILYWGLTLSGGEIFTWSALTTVSPKIPPMFLKTAFLFILVGFGTKAGLFPLHTWLPDAHSQAPSPVCALLSGVETTTALYVIIRLLPVLQGIPGHSVSTWFVIFGLISVGAAAFLLIQVKDYKRLFAFSTIEHMGIILVAAGISGEAAHLGATYQIMTHAVTKSFCFFAAGSALLITKTRYIASIRGLIRISPIVGISLLIGGLAIAGAPPFAVFVSEFSIFKAGIADGQYIIIGLLIFFIAIAFWGIINQVNKMVFGKAFDSPGRSALPPSCIVALALAVIPVMVFGLSIPEPLHNLLRFAATAFGR
jgi:hydrogenase-4 component F